MREDKIMSKETLQWLNTRTLIGHTDKRGNAWHYRADEQGGEPNHYAGAVPVDDVRRRLFAWSFAEGAVSSTVLDADGVTTYSDDTRKAIIRPRGTFGPDDPGAILGLFRDGYRVHPFSEWLVSHVETILDDGLSIASAGLLKGGAVAWVQVETPDTVTTPEGVAFRPYLTAATSVDGSLATTYQTGVQAVVCDNTLSAALGERDAGRVKIKHSRQSLGRVGEIRDALGIVYETADAFAAQVAQLVSTTVSDAQWSAFLDAHAPLVDKGKPLTGRSLTMAENMRGTLNKLYRWDQRVAPWTGTAFGVVQAVNTYTHHEGIVRGASRVERNMLRMVTGGADQLDQGTLDTLNRVLANA